MGCLRVLAASGAVALALLLCPPESARGASLSAKDEPEDPEDPDEKVATDQEEDAKAEDDMDTDDGEKSATGSAVAATVDAQGVGKVEVAPDDKKDEAEKEEREPNPVAMSEEEAALADGAADSADSMALSQEGDAKTIDSINRSVDATKYCFTLHGFCWMWASPCSGGCSRITDEDMKKATWCQDSVARLPTQREFVLVRRTLEDNRDLFHSRCSASVFNMEHGNCDLLDDFVFKEDEGFNELVLVCKLPGAPPTNTVPASGEKDKATLEKQTAQNITENTAVKTDAKPANASAGKLLNALGSWASERLASFKIIS
jgi:hypothetical protein